MLIPKPIRKFLAIFRGDVAPLLILISFMLGFWFGLMPGWQGLHMALLILALILNINIGLFIISAALGRALCYAAAPLLYYLGDAVQSWAEPLLATLANTPIIGISDYDRYAVAGALLAGPVLGIVGGALLARVVTVFRKTWLKLEENSAAFRTWQAKSWVRWLEWLLIGKRADVRTTLARKTRPVRIAGVVVAMLVLAAGGAGVYLTQGDQLRGYAERHLTDLNGATVSFGGFDLRPLAGHFRAQDAQAADPQRLSHNRLQLATLTADIDNYALSCGDLVLQNVEIDQLAFDQPRQAAAALAPAAASPDQETEKPATFDSLKFELAADSFSKLEEFVADAKQLRSRLREASEWLPEPDPPAPKSQAPQHYLEYLTARAVSKPAPRIVIERVALGDVSVPYEMVGRADVTLLNLSDAPAAAGRPVEMRLQSKDGNTSIDMTLDYGAGGGATIAGWFKEVDLGRLQRGLSGNNPAVFEGGVATVEIEGTATRDTIDLSLVVDARELRLRGNGTMFGLDRKATDEALKALDQIKTRLRLVGPIGEPRLVFDVEHLLEAFKEALINAGKREMISRLNEAIGDKIPEGAPKVEDVVDDPVETGKKTLKGLEGLFKGKKEEADGG